MSPGLHTITVAEVAAIVRAQFPWLTGEVVLLGKGLDHQAFEIDGHVIRFSGPDEVAGALAREMQLTGRLAGRLPLAIPVYVLEGVAAGGLRFAGYRKLAGTPGILVDAIAPVSVGRGLGAFLRALHGVDVTLAETPGLVADDDADEWVVEALADLERAAHHVQPGSRAAVLRLLAEGLPASSARCVLHGDFAAEHALMSPDGRPTGVIDWSDARLGDPTVDLAGLFHGGGEALLDAASASYGPIDAATRVRAVWYAVCRGLGDLVFGDRHGRPEYIAAGTRALAFATHADHTRYGESKGS